MTFTEIILTRIVSGVLGAFLLFLEVYKAQEVERKRTILEEYYRNGLFDKIMLFKNNPKEFSIQDRMETEKSITREDAEKWYESTLKPPSNSFEKFGAALYKIVEIRIKEKAEILESYVEQTSPEVLKCRKRLLFFGITLILLSAAIDFYQHF